MSPLMPAAMLTRAMPVPDDLCRYPIFAKVPWLPKNDPAIQVQMEEIPNFYEYEAASAIVQGVGRGAP
jgi:Rad3-related DNA helicase